MLKLIGSIAWIFACCLFGLEIIRYNRSRVRQIAAFADLIKFIKLKIEYYAQPIPEILKECDSDLLLRCGFCDTFPQEINELCGDSILFLDSECEKIVNSFCQGIGKGYRDNEVRLCESYMRELCDRLEKSKEAGSKNEKLTVTLCFCFSGIVLLLLL